MPVAVVGMHRSGTSLLAHMLHRSGVYLGPGDRLLRPGDDNPQGFWEHTGFQQLNEALLAELGGRWDAPPVSPKGWTENPRLAPRAADAQRLIDEFAGREPWGWKDPRTSLTLQFWLELVPDLKIVMCIRNPLEVAASLHRRNRFDHAMAIRLWQLYNDRILKAPVAKRLVVSYEQVLADAEAELARVLTFLGIETSFRTLGHAAEVCRDDLRHARLGRADLHAVGCHPHVLDLYTRLQAEAGIDIAGLAPAPWWDGLDRTVDERALQALLALQQPAPSPGDNEQIMRITQRPDVRP